MGGCSANVSKPALIEFYACLRPHQGTVACRGIGILHLLKPLLGQGEGFASHVRIRIPVHVSSALGLGSLR